MDDDYEIPIPFHAKQSTRALHQKIEEDFDSSESDFMDLNEMKPALPDTVPVKVDNRSATLFVPVSDRTSSHNRLEKRRLTTPENQAVHSINLRRSVSFASWETNSIQKMGNPIQRSHPYPRPAQVSNAGKNLERSTSVNSVAFVVSVHEPPQTPLPPFVQPHRKGISKSQTFNEADNRKINKHVQLRPLKGTPKSRSPTIPRATLRDSAIDLISDEENSEAYAAVSLAGTLSRNVESMSTPKSRRNKKLVVAVSILSLVVVLLIAAVVTVVLLKFK